MIEYHKFTNDKLKLDQSEFHTKFHLTPTNNINYILCLLIKPIQNSPETIQPAPLLSSGPDIYTAFHSSDQPAKKSQP